MIKISACAIYTLEQCVFIIRLSDVKSIDNVSYFELQSLGPYIKDVRTGSGEGGSPKADIVREVAWI